MIGNRVIRNDKKRIVALILTIVLVLQSTNALFAQDMEPTISAANVRAVEDRIVNVDIKMAQNPGLVSLKLEVFYDNDTFQLVNVIDGQLLGSAYHGLDAETIKKDPYALVWMNATKTEDFTDNGVLATLQFKVKKDAALGEYPIALFVDELNTSNANLETVPFNVVNGKINVVNIKPGDVDYDGKVTVKDCMQILRKIANWVDFKNVDELASDVNGDGKVTVADGVIMIRHIAQWVGYEILPYRNKAEHTDRKLYSLSDYSDGISFELFDDFALEAKVPEGNFELSKNMYVTKKEYGLNNDDYTDSFKAYRFNWSGYTFNFTDYLNNSNLPSSITLKSGSRYVKYNVAYKDGLYTFVPAEGSAIEFFYNLDKDILSTTSGRANYVVNIPNLNTYIAVPGTKLGLKKAYRNTMVPATIENDLASLVTVSNYNNCDDLRIAIGKGAYVSYDDFFMSFDNDTVIKVSGLDASLFRNIRYCSFADFGAVLCNAMAGEDVVIEFALKATDDAETARKAAEEAERKAQEEAEVARKAAEEARAAEEAARKAAEEAARKAQEEADAAAKKAAEEAERLKKEAEEAEAKRLAEEAEAARLKKEAEELAAKEAAEKAAAEEAARRAAEEAANNLQSRRLSLRLR